MKTISNFILLLFLPLSVFVTFSFSFNKKSPDNPTISYKPISFSTKKINTIEIFSDGFDPIEFQNTSNFLKLNGFHFFPKVAGSGFFTDNGFNDMFSGLELSWNSRLAIIQKMNNWEKTNGIKKSIKTIIGTTDIPTPQNVKNYVGGWSGNGRTLEEMKEIKNNNINVMNWSRAINDMYEKHSNISLSPFSAQYENFLDDIYVRDSQPSFTQIMENISHHPIMINKYGEMNPIFRINAEHQSFEYLSHFLKRLEDKLIKLGVFDNTIIAIYGDHASHSRTILPEPYQENIDSLKPISGFLIKPINSNNDKIKIHNKATLDSIFIRKIINKNYGNSFNLSDWLKSKEAIKNIYTNRVFELIAGSGVNKTIWFYKIIKNNKNQWVATSAFKDQKNADGSQKHSWYKYPSNQASKIIKEERINIWKEKKLTTI